MKNRTSELIKLAVSARHYGLSVSVLTQQLTSIAKPFRENASRLVACYNPNRKEMRTLLDEYLEDATRRNGNSKKAEDGEIRRTPAAIKKASEKTLRKWRAEVEKKRERKANEFLTDLLLSKFAGPN